ncbi:MAG: sulfotransferase family 2 domain-containing protein [Gammaproteobacteria bacterium]|nr:sulfotransferase family 2 domain-containing protein [Gammaproteobacteria bacterium]
MNTQLLAFVHIEKAAGTTLIYLLRHNYLFRYLDVRPFSSSSQRVFTAADLARCLKLNPFLRSIGGHAVKPHSDLEILAPGIRYITLLRDPVERYLSQFRYWNRVFGKGWDFERFLRQVPSQNFQTRKLAGSPDLELAKDMLAERFFLVGLAEKFDEFLVMLTEKLRPEVFNPVYLGRNVGSADRHIVAELKERHADRILANNALDLELYRFVEQELLPQARNEHGAALAAQVEELARRRAGARALDIRLLLDGLSRKLYYEPVTSLLRWLNGLPVKGSY